MKNFYKKYYNNFEIKKKKKKKKKWIHQISIKMNYFKV
jgi:hypothetical protein